MTHEKMTIVVGARPERLSRFIVAVSEQHLADVAVVRPGQEIAFPMARHRPIFNRRRSLTD